ncbi:MAG: ABC transporter ATP-binding protein/permease [Candidatus Nomurabacteria bacterium]|nr:ABC transporter ATP-binding protein/permease [Candidatus Nomurabacteria bacterium]
MKDRSKHASIKKRTLAFFWHELKQHKILMVTMIVCAILNVFVMNSATPFFLAKIIDKLTLGDYHVETILADFAPLIALFIGMIFLGEIIFVRLVVWTLWKLEVISVYELNRKSFDTLSEQSMQFHNNRFSGSLVSQVNKFSSAFERLIDLTIFDIIPLAFTVSFTLLILGFIMPLYALGLFVFILIYVAVAVYAYKKIALLNAKLASAETKQSGQLADSASNIMAIKSYANEAHEKKRFDGFLQRTANANLAILRAVNIRDLGFGVVTTLISALLIIFIVGGGQWFGLSIGTVVLLYTYTSTILGLLWGFNHILRNLNSVFGDAHDMTQILDEEMTVKDDPNATKLLVEKGEVEFANISFMHESAKETIFQNFSLKIKAGEKIGLVGVSGSGKTTLTKLLLRFADVDSGAILIDNQNISEVTQDSLRENIAYVPQESTLFHRSLRENIAYGKQQATDEEIITAAEKANAWEFIKDLPNGLDTLTGERGVKLSGGQRQRVNIARAILKDAPILVLDEATSALDSESESLIQEALKKLMKGRTSLVIAHRLSTVAALDRIIVLENGKIVEEGSHKELLKQNGTYAELWNRQTGGYLNESELAT